MAIGSRSQRETFKCLRHDHQSKKSNYPGKVRCQLVSQYSCVKQLALDRDVDGPCVSKSAGQCFARQLTSTFFCVRVYVCTCVLACALPCTLQLFALCFVVMLPSMPSSTLVPLFSAKTATAVSHMPTTSPAATAFDYRLKECKCLFVLTLALSPLPPPPPPPLTPCKQRTSAAISQIFGVLLFSLLSVRQFLTEIFNKPNKQ